MYNEDVLRFYYSMYSKCQKSQWKKFMNKLKTQASAEDKFELIEFSNFENVVNNVLGLKVSQK